MVFTRAGADFLLLSPCGVPVSPSLFFCLPALFPRLLSFFLTENPFFFGPSLPLLPRIVWPLRDKREDQSETIHGFPLIALTLPGEEKGRPVFPSLSFRNLMFFFFAIDVFPLSTSSFRSQPRFFCSLKRLEHDFLFPPSEDLIVSCFCSKNGPIFSAPFPIRYHFLSAGDHRIVCHHSLSFSVFPSIDPLYSPFLSPAYVSAVAPLQPHASWEDVPPPPGRCPVLRTSSPPAPARLVSLFVTGPR